MATLPAEQGQAIGRAGIERLGDRLRRRGVRRIAYFHCDHFEPWRHAPGSETPEANARDVASFAEMTAASEHARRLTLFYKPKLRVMRAATNPTALTAGEGDYLGFLPQDEKLETLRSASMRALIAAAEHEIQVHIHHENFTWNTGLEDATLAQELAKPDSRARDAARFELALRMSLETMRRETGLALATWHFVHGQWALNASDSSVCQIAEELAILWRNGCLGDFTFPAGRGHCNPVHETPFLVDPIVAVRGYDSAEAAPERAWANGWAAAEKFFIWASAIRHEGSSFDYFNPRLKGRLEDTAGFAEDVVARSVVAGDTLWFKTHAHSLHPLYLRPGEPILFPHDHPAVRRLMGTVFDAGTAADAEIAYVTADEAYRAFVAAEEAAPAADGWSLAVPAGAIRPMLGAGGLARRVEIDRIASRQIIGDIAALGPRQAGAGDYYQKRAEKSRILAPYELEIAQLLLAQSPKLGQVYEAGSGASVLTMLLAANGQPATALDRDTVRIELGRRIHERVVAETGPFPAPCELRLAAVPAALRDIDPHDAALVFTNVTGSITDADEAEIIRLGAAFRLVIVDLARFLRVRDEAGQAELLARFADAGYAPPLRLAAQPSYRLFTHLDEDDD